MKKKKKNDDDDDDSYKLPFLQLISSDYFLSINFFRLFSFNYFLSIIFPRFLFFTVSLFTAKFPGSFTAVDLTLHMKLCSQQLQAQAAVRSSYVSNVDLIYLFNYLIIQNI